MTAKIRMTIATAAFVTLGVLVGCQTRAPKVIVHNNFPFESDQPVYLRDGTVVDRSHRTTKILDVMPTENGVAIKYNGKDLGKLTWGVVRRQSQPDVDKQPPSTKQEFKESFKPLPLSFAKTATNTDFETYTAHGEAEGLALHFKLRAFPNGFLDLTTDVTNVSAPTTRVYAAVIARWEQSNISRRTAGYNFESMPLDGNASTLFREGTERHLFVQRGCDWINNTFSTAGVAWLNDFTASFTVHKEATEKTPARWLGANTAQLAQEAQSAGNTLFSITEIARPNVPMYRSRLSDSVLPQPGEPALAINSRMIFYDAPIRDEQIDQLFVAYTGWKHEDKEHGSTTLTLGVPFTKFGTNYFPYSTLGENFIDARMPGMSKEGYWPLAAATVNEYEKFADNIKRDLRVLKSMGFTLDRLHHLEVLWDKDPQGKEFVTQEKREAYLDFYFDQLKQLDLKALVDVKLPPETVAWLVSRYRPLIEGVEIDNEVLIFQIYDEDVQYWKDVYAAVQSVAPEIPVHLTCHTNTGAFDRLKQLGVPFDKVGAHAYLDSVTAIPSSRDYALAVGNYAGKQNKEAAITEWNWRFLTRMTDDARAKVYAPIFENVLKTHSISTMYQFQFNDGLAMNPAGLKGIRHYELIHLSRRPKPEALELVSLISQYSDPKGLVHRIDTGLATSHVTTVFRDGTAHAAFKISNVGAESVRLKPTMECFDGATATLDDNVGPTITLASGASKQIAFNVAAPKSAQPGFYHVFLRMEDDKGHSRYAWAEARLEGNVTLDRTPTKDDAVTYGDGALDFDFNRPLAVVYGQGAPIPELEAAWVLYQTLEAATGRVVSIYELKDLPADVRKSGVIVAFGTPASNELIAKTGVKLDKPSVEKSSGDGHGDWLIVGGADTAGVQAAAMDLTLRYWKSAKYSGIRRVGTTQAPSGQGGVKTDID